jgi:hypothetical protein
LDDPAGEFADPTIEVMKPCTVAKRHDKRGDRCNQIRKPDQAEQKPKTVHAVAPPRARGILAISGWCSDGKVRHILEPAQTERITL